jgi:hypothetical protein
MSYCLRCKISLTKCQPLKDNWVKFPVVSFCLSMIAAKFELIC